jgi:hypothetical protein
MKITTALTKRMKAVSRLIDLYQRARHYGLRSTDINRQFSEIKAKMGKVPYWVLAYLEGYRDALTAENYAHHLDFRFTMEGGVMVSTSRKSDIYYEKLGYKPGDLSDRPNGHYWEKNGKPYFNHED